MSNPYILDYSVKDNIEFHDFMRSDVQKNKIRFEFPEGFSKIPIIEECRAVSEYNNPEQFDLLYDIVMQLLAGKAVKILMKTESGKYVTFSQFIVTDRYMDLRGVQELNEFPIVVMWMVDVIVCSLTKKYPVPLLDEAVMEPRSKKELGTMTKKRKTPNAQEVQKLRQ